MHWLSDGLIHVRLTDSAGLQVLDTTMQVLGPSSGGGGGGGSTVDPTTIASTGDIKFRPTSETLSGWVILNGQTIGSASSGASQRANADTQNLFVYLWNNCTNAHCPVPGGRGVSAIADFNANKQITVYDMRDRILVGRDCMGNSCAGGLLSSNITSGGGDGVDTAAASGGAANQTAATTLSQANLPNVNFPNSGITLSYPNIGECPIGTCTNGGNANFAMSNTSSSTINFNNINGAIAVGISSQGHAASGGSGTAATSASFAVMNPFTLGNYYMKL